jgi:diguanylate cyclase (GGDEF)-like protein
MTGLYNRRYFGEVSTKLVLEDTLPISVIIGDINGLKLINDAFGHELGDKLIKETAEILKTSVRSSDIVSRIGGDEFAIFLPQTPMETADAVLSRIEKGSLAFNEKNVDTPIKISISLGLSTMKSREESLEDTIRTAEDIMYKNKLFQHRSSHNSIMTSIKDMLARRGEIIEENLSSLQCIARQLGEELGLKDDMIQQLIMLASIHDLGKVTIDAEILSKRGPLSDEEWTVLRKHPEMGYRIAMASMELAAIADFILSHHERWDGTGYPSGLIGEDIPLLSRIISILDAYDAMTTGRPYRKGLPKEEAIKEIMENAGTQFDPRIAGVFVRLMSEADLMC